MYKVGDEYIQVESMEKCMIMHDNKPSLNKGGWVYVRHNEGKRERIPYEKFESDYVEK